MAIRPVEHLLQARQVRRVEAAIGVGIADQEIAIRGMPFVDRQPNELQPEPFGGGELRLGLDLVHHVGAFALAVPEADLAVARAGRGSEAGKQGSQHGALPGRLHRPASGWEKRRASSRFSTLPMALRGKPSRMWTRRGARGPSRASQKEISSSAVAAPRRMTAAAGIWR